MSHRWDWICYNAQTWRTKRQASCHCCLATVGARSKSLWWQADVELNRVGERKEMFGRDGSLARAGGGVDVQVFVSYYGMLSL